MNSDEEELIKHIDELIIHSRYYFYNKEYKEHIKRLEKLKKLIEKGETKKYVRKGCDIY